MSVTELKSFFWSTTGIAQNCGSYFNPWLNAIEKYVFIDNKTSRSLLCRFLYSKLVLCVSV